MMVSTAMLMLFSGIGFTYDPQKHFITYGFMIIITIYGVAILSILAVFFFGNWFKQNLWFSFVIFFSTVVAMIDMKERYDGNHLFFHESINKTDIKESDPGEAPLQKTNNAKTHSFISSEKVDNSDNAVSVNEDSSILQTFNTGSLYDSKTDASK